jgi:hypothetical protein
MPTIRYEDEKHRKARSAQARYIAKHVEENKARAAAWRAENLERARAYDRERGVRPSNMAPERKRLSKWASQIVRRAIARGEIVRPEIGECGHSGIIESAHADYSDPMVFRWLCQPCHRRWDRLEPKTKVPY